MESEMIVKAKIPYFVNWFRTLVQTNKDFISLKINGKLHFVEYEYIDPIDNKELGYINPTLYVTGRDLYYSDRLSDKDEQIFLGLIEILPLDEDRVQVVFTSKFAEFGLLYIRLYENCVRAWDVDVNPTQGYISNNYSGKELDSATKYQISANEEYKTFYEILKQFPDYAPKSFLPIWKKIPKHSIDREVVLLWNLGESYVKIGKHVWLSSKRVANILSDYRNDPNYGEDIVPYKEQRNRKLIQLRTIRDNTGNNTG